ncbi:hypothetical protein PIB30_031102 [Stylosanthes scabra]|uniref:Ubiquitin-like protease family profile domain-containing protein n=1 Tax=Stylosanthes scabra TaxID=79078 RepID=A0ABU6UEG3_9FABA|nr:hypothetical protein [Stylosanthes scabra]
MGHELPPESQPDPSVPSFNFGPEFERPLATKEQPPKTPAEEPPQLETPQPTQMIKNDLEESVANWATVVKGKNSFDTIFKLRGHRFLETMRCQFMSMAPGLSASCDVLNAEENERFEKLVYCVLPEILQRMFEPYHHNWMDKKKKKPREISTLKNHQDYLIYLDKERLVSHRFLFTPVLYSEHWWIYVVDVAQLEIFVLNSKNIVSPNDERTTLNQFASNILDQMLRWARAPSMFKKGCCNNSTAYNIKQWTGPMLEEFRKKIVTKIILSKENSLRAEAIKAANDMRVTRPGPALRSPYVQISTPNLPSK